LMVCRGPSKILESRGEHLDVLRIDEAYNGRANQHSRTMTEKRQDFRDMVIRTWGVAGLTGRNFGIAFMKEKIGVLREQGERGFRTDHRPSRGKTELLYPEGGKTCSGK